jgi:hypothetical protein
MDDKRKETFKKASRKRKEKLIDAGKQRLDTFVSQTSIVKIDEFKEKNNCVSRGEAIDQLLKK